MIKKGSVHDASKLAQAIRRQIVDQGLKSGSRLPTHSELSRRYGVGLRLLREAMSILRQEGWIETRRRGGTVVTEPALEVLREPIRWHLTAQGYTFDDLLEARAAVESIVAAAAAQRRTARDLLRIMDAVDRYEETTEPEEEAEKADEAFHQAVLHASHNPVLLIFGQLIAEQFRDKLRQLRFTTVQRKRKSACEHRSILRQIQNRRSEEARKRMHRHVLQQRLDEANPKKTSQARESNTQKKKAAK